MNRQLEIYKEYIIKKIEVKFELVKEKEKLNRESRLDSFQKKEFSFIEKVFKNREYKKYNKNMIEYNQTHEQRENKRQQRILEIDQVLKEDKDKSSKDIELEIRAANMISSFKDVEQTPDEIIKELIVNGIDPQFESYEQAFALAANYLGTNLDFMKKAVDDSYENIIYDKTNNEELYKEVIDKLIEDMEPNFIESESILTSLQEYKKELINPKQVESDKYKVPHKYMFEELRNNIKFKRRDYWYLTVDGVYDKTFGDDMESLYEDPEYFIGIHGRENVANVSDNIESAIFKMGLKNSTQDANNCLDRTVAYAENLTFTKALNYRIPYNGAETEIAIILRIPYAAFDKKNPIPIWGSNNREGSENYLLPEYVYGLYREKADGANRKIIKNTVIDKEKYKYIKYDFHSVKVGKVELTEEIMKSSLVENQAQSLVNQMAQGIDVLQENQETIDVRRMGYIKLWILVLLTTTFSIGIILLGILLR